MSVLKQIQRLASGSPAVGWGSGGGSPDACLGYSGAVEGAVPPPAWAAEGAP